MRPSCYWSVSRRRTVGNMPLSLPWTENIPKEKNNLQFVIQWQGIEFVYMRLERIIPWIYYVYNPYQFPSIWLCKWKLPESLYCFAYLCAVNNNSHVSRKIQYIRDNCWLDVINKTLHLCQNVIQSQRFQWK